MTKAVNRLVTAAFLGAAYWLVQFSYSAELAALPMSSHLYLGMFVAGLAGMLLSYGTRYFVFTFWLVLAFIAQGAFLQAVEAGTAVRYQFLRFAVGPLSGYDSFLLAILCIQTILVIIGIWPHRSTILEWFRTRLGITKTVALLVLLLITSGFPYKDPRVLVIGTLACSLFYVVQLGCMFLAVRVAPGELLTSLGKAFSAHPEQKPENIPGTTMKWPRPWVLVAAAWVTSVAAFLAHLVWESHPHIPDEVAYLFHARYFAQGMIVAPGVVVPEAFETFLIHCETTKCYSVFLPGWPAALSLGVLAGVPWMVNPILAGINILLIYILASSLYDRRIGLLTTALCCISPWYIFLAMSFMAHIFSLFCALTASLAILAHNRTQRVIWLIVAGLATGTLGLTRPLEGAVLGLFLGTVILMRRGWRMRLLSFAMYGFSMLATTLLLLQYNRAVTGDALTLPLSSYLDSLWGTGANTLGFGPDRGASPHWNSTDAFPGHSVAEAAINGIINIQSINTELLGWSVGSLIPLYVFFLVGKLQRTDLVLIFAVVLLTGLHSFYWYGSGPDFGARYWFLILFPILVLISRGLLQEYNMLAGSNCRNIAGGALVLAVTLQCAFSVLNYWPWRALDKYYHYWGMSPSARTIANDPNFETTLFLVRGQQHPDYSSAMIYNPIDISTGGPLFAWDKNASVRQRLQEEFSDWDIVTLEGPTLTDNGYHRVSP